MALLKIAQMGHPVLRAASLEVPLDLIATHEVQRLVDDMVDTMRDTAGVGLAAPQVHAPKRIIAIEIRDTVRYPDVDLFELIVVVNPLVTPLSSGTREGWEGCLSMFGIRGRVLRHEVVRLTGTRRDGQSLDIELQGFPAVVAQHECDHLDGSLFVDRMQDMRSLCFDTEYRRFHMDPPPPHDTAGEPDPVEEVGEPGPDTIVDSPPPPQVCDG